jgi:hypothetical protein
LVHLPEIHSSENISKEKTNMIIMVKIEILEILFAKGDKK